ncbi:N-acyl amino acid synthase FeeM domain-containing protein [Desulfonatronum thiodismutans]|uniref:N-acyl amino acid synthase FeeM domain-containing protein n=1 Tax=Desulfonatronum thiodismutans TaxID=159290 RepID=UPI0004ABD3CA|nr:hypothetical protein [Desulfonatronum thiodismutans]
MTVHPEQLLQERRRSVRLRRSAMLRAKLDEIDRPNIKIAETQDELAQSFALVYQEYLASGYIKTPHSSEMHLSVYNFLPKTCVYIFRSYTKVISTLSQIFDSELFGLPMDALYQPELDALRAKGRKVTELSALATPKETRWCNLMVFLSKTMFEYSRLVDVDDICIMVNPKHVNFYKTMFLFDDFGPERFYEGVGAPAVALRIDMDTIEEKLSEKYQDFDVDGNLHAFFCKMNTTMQELQSGWTFHEKRHPMDADVAKVFFEVRPDVYTNLSLIQKQYLQKFYPFLSNGKK